MWKTFHKTSYQHTDCGIKTRNYLYFNEFSTFLHALEISTIVKITFKRFLMLNKPVKLTSLNLH